MAPLKGIDPVSGDLDCAGHRKALPDGADPVIVSGWINETQGERLRAEKDLKTAQPAGAVSVKEVRALAESLGDVAAALAKCRPEVEGAAL